MKHFDKPPASDIFVLAFTHAAWIQTWFITDIMSRWTFVTQWLTAHLWIRSYREDWTNSVLYKYWLLRVLWLKLQHPRWSPERSIFPRCSWEKMERSGITEGVILLTIALQVVNICLITLQQTIYHPYTRNVRTRVLEYTDAQLIGFEVGKKMSGYYTLAAW